MGDKTTISLKKTTYDILYRMKKPRQSWDDFFLEEYEEDDFGNDS